MTTPAWQAPISGARNNLNAVDASAHLNQFLGDHAVQQIYDGVRVVSSSGGTQLTFIDIPDSLDFDQPFTLSGTSIGRIQVPLLPVGNGADVLVELWPDNGSGSPNTTGNPIASTFISAAYLDNVVARQGIENATVPALMNERNNELGFTGSVTSNPWLAPSNNDALGAVATAVVCTTSDSMLFLGGLNNTLTAESAVCASTTVSEGTLQQPIPQPSLPVATSFGGATVVNESLVVYLGGITAASQAVSSVWAASWTPGTHAIGAWSAQTALPQAVQYPAVASWGNFVYSIGGADASNNSLATVMLGTVVNSQISWKTLAPFPITVVNPFVVTCQGWLFVYGGRTGLSSSTGLNSFYYAKINQADGSLGPWITGPNLPAGAYAIASGWDAFATENSIFQLDGHGTGGAAPIQTMSVTAAGPSGFWYVTNWSTVGDMPLLPINLGDGQYDVFALLYFNGTYLFSTLTPMPYVSVPLHATGLTSGATYHVLLRAVNASSASDGMQLGILDDTPLPATVLKSNRHWSSWSPVTFTYYAVPLRVWDASTSANGLVRHVVEDPVNGVAQRWSSVFYGANELAVGFADTTMHPNLALNSNPTFTSGTSPWTATNGTLTQSSAQTHGGFAFSGLLTPTGGFSLAYVQSELFPAAQSFFGAAAWLYPSGWFYTPTTWSNFSLSMNWFDSSKTYISTSSSTPVTLTGATWTFVSNFFQPPAGAAYGSLVPTMSGSPSSANTLFMSDVFAVKATETVGALSAVAEIDYAAGTLWPPIGVTTLN